MDNNDKHPSRGNHNKGNDILKNELMGESDTVCKIACNGTCYSYFVDDFKFISMTDLCYLFFKNGAIELGSYSGSSSFYKVM